MRIKQAIVNGKGETLTLNLEYQDSAGAPVDLTGHSVDLIVTKAGNTFYTANAAVDGEGNISITVADEVTALWDTGKYGYKVVHTNPAGDKKWLMYGTINVIDVE